MADTFKITVDLGDLPEQMGAARELVTTKVSQAIQYLAAQTHARILESAQTKLRSTRKAYTQALRPLEQIEDNLWVVTLDGSARWIEDGKAAGSMVDDLLNHKSGKPARKGRDGSLYRPIPFDQATPQTETPLSRVALGEAVRAELKRYSKRIGRTVGLRKIETGPDGRPLTGALHTFSVDSPRGRSGVPILAGIKIYQRLCKARNGKMKAQRSVVSFRIVSSKHKEDGRWMYPGLTGKKFMDEAYQWALKEWQDSIMPMLHRGMRVDR